MDEIPGVTFIQGDFTNAETISLLHNAMSGQLADLIISDLAPNLTGIKQVDQLRCVGLYEEVLASCEDLLKPGSNLLLKVFQGSELPEFRKTLAKHF